MQQEALASPAVQADADKFKHFIRALEATNAAKLDIPARTYYDYLAGRFPRILAMIVDRPELAVALLRDAMDAADERKRSE